MTIITDLSKLREARLKQEKAILLKDTLDHLSADDLVQVEKLHDEIEELHELMLMYLYKKKAMD